MKCYVVCYDKFLTYGWFKHNVVFCYECDSVEEQQIVYENCINFKDTKKANKVKNKPVDNDKTKYKHIIKNEKYEFWYTKDYMKNKYNK